MKATVNTNNSVAQQQIQRCQEVGFPGGSAVKSPLATWVPSLIREDPLEKEMATHSSIIAWKISRTEEPGGLHMVL